MGWWGEQAMSYRALWRQAAANFLLDVLVSVVPVFVFYSLAFDYTPGQLKLLAGLALPGIAAFLLVDLLILTAVLRQVRAAFAENAIATELDPLLAQAEAAAKEN